MGLVNLSETDAGSIKCSIEQFMLAKGIDLSKCLFVSLDGTNVMSGELSGLQRRINPLIAYYIHKLSKPSFGTRFCPFVQKTHQFKEYVYINEQSEWKNPCRKKNGTINNTH